MHHTTPPAHTTRHLCEPSVADVPHDALGAHGAVAGPPPLVVGVQGDPGMQVQVKVKVKVQEQVDWCRGFRGAGGREQVKMCSTAQVACREPHLQPHLVTMWNLLACHRWVSSHPGRPALCRLGVERGEVLWLRLTIKEFAALLNFALLQYCLS